MTISIVVIIVTLNMLITRRHYHYYCERKLSLEPQSRIVLTHTMVHPSLGQVLIRQRWEVSLPDVGLSKTLRIRPAPRATNSEEGNI